MLSDYKIVALKMFRVFNVLKVGFWQLFSQLKFLAGGKHGF